MVTPSEAWWRAVAAQSIATGDGLSATFREPFSVLGAAIVQTVRLRQMGHTGDRAMSRSRIWTVLVLGLVGSLSWGCSTSSHIDPAVRELIDVIERVDVPDRYAFSFVPDSPSPFVACLAGVDEIDGVVDAAARAVQLKPRRAAPEVIVTEDELFVADLESQIWAKAEWSPSLDQGLLTSIFGETLAERIVVGVRSPDPNATALGAIEVADSVMPVGASDTRAVESFVVEIDEEALAGLASADVSDDSGPAIEEIRLVVTATPEGLVTSTAVTTGSVSESYANYVIHVSYENVPGVVLPPSENQRPVSLSDLQYPDAQSSCSFGQ